MPPQVNAHGIPRPPMVLRRAANGRRWAHAPETVAAARALVEGTPLSYAVIAAQVGIDAMSVGGWARRGGWVRPPDAPPPGRPAPRRPPRKGRGADKRRRAAERALAESERTPPRPPRAVRARGQPYRADTVEAVRRLVVGTVAPIRAIARRTGVCDESIRAWMRRRGWERPPRAPKGRPPRDRDEMAAAKAKAREMVEGTLLPTDVIARSAGVSPESVLRWKRAEGWFCARRAERQALCRARRAGRGRRTFQPGDAVPDYAYFARLAPTTPPAGPARNG